MVVTSVKTLADYAGKNKYLSAKNEIDNVSHF